MSLLNSRYALHEVLGAGTYGRVLRCTDTYTGQQVAIKIAKRDAAYRRSAINEINVLRLLSHCDETVNMLNFFEEDGHVCIVSELLSTDLYELVNASSFQPLSLQAMRVCAERILRALLELHRVGYMHCDIKPANVMLRPNGIDMYILGSYAKTCLIDFGAVRQFHENMYYDIQSLWYRAPEVILGVPYTPLIDSWSVGCLLFEMYTGSPLFPGDSAQEQLFRIASTVGMPPIEVVLSGVNATVLQLPCAGADMNAESQLRSLVAKYRFGAGCVHENSKSIEEEEAFLNLLSMLLQPDARMRLSCADALRQPFFTACCWQNVGKGINDLPVNGVESSGLWGYSDEMMSKNDYATQCGTLCIGAKMCAYNSLDCFAPQCHLPRAPFFQHMSGSATRPEIANNFLGNTGDISFLDVSKQSLLGVPHVQQPETMCFSVPMRHAQHSYFNAPKNKRLTLQLQHVNMCVSTAALPVKSFGRCCGSA